MITQERLQELVDYNPDTGQFIWLQRTGPKKAGTQAGSSHHSGYRFIKVDGNMYAEHRLAYYYVHGYFPENDVDHINRIRDDNRIENLREATRQCNTRNTCQSKNNTSGIRGVYFFKSENKWSARICVNRRPVYLGIFSDKLEAAAHRLAAEQCLGFQDCNINSSAKKAIDKYLKESHEVLEGV